MLSVLDQLPMPWILDPDLYKILPEDNSFFLVSKTSQQSFVWCQKPVNIVLPGTQN